VSYWLSAKTFDQVTFDQMMKHPHYITALRIKEFKNFDSGQN